ncbi:hypothetical protein CFOL_v3_18590 [Cephalotus follicularis]|uniref:Uncharacterized protein n=1 Tax=Cephalotus follicularis TaxID=3775 RepID=A0A1Q3C4R8_CEPFO|nr:hypothetical protein CFOL_v3_18590 [Cephalotus follicularis]
MKGSCTLVASVLAASTVAMTSSSSNGDLDVAYHPCCNQGMSVKSGGLESEKEKFAPRFDGLRFIETLVTGHR